MRSMLSSAIAMAGVVGLIVASTDPVTAAGSRVRLEAKLKSAGTAASGKAQFQSERGRQRFTVQIEDAAPNAAHAVAVDGVIVGNIATDAVGRGDLNFDSNFEAGIDDPATKFPANFPVIGPGTMIVVAGGGDTLTGGFASR